MIMAAFILAAVDPAAGQNPKTKPKQTTNQQLIDAEAKLIEDNLHVWWKKWSKKGDDDKNFMGPEEAAKAFGYTLAYNSARLSTPSASAAVSTSTSSDSEANKPLKTPVSDALKRRLDWIFINTLDKDNDEKVSEEEFNDWAKAYALVMAEEAVLSSQLAKNPNGANAKQQQQRLNQLQKQMQQHMRGLGKAISSKRG
jgi:hypothetical protein